MQQNFLTRLIDYLTGFFLICLSFLVCIFVISSNVTVVRGFELLPIALLLSGSAGVVLLANSFLKELKVLDVFASSTLMGYGLGAYNTYLSAGEFWTTYQIQYSSQNIAFVVIFLNLYSLALIALARTSTLDSRLVGKISSALWVARPITCKRFLRSSLILSGIQAALIISGKAVVTGDFAAFSSFSTFSSTTAGGFEKGYLTILYALVSVMSLLCGILFSLVARKKLSANWSIYFILLTNVVWLFLSGRRSLLYGVLTLFLGFCLATPVLERIAMYQSFSIRKIVSLVLIVIVLAVGWDFFAFMRTYNRSLSTSPASHSLVANLADGFSEYVSLATNPKNADSYEKFKEDISKNVSTRTFLLDFLTQSFQLVETKGPMIGKDLSANILVALPSNFFVDKSKLLRAEPLYNKVYALKLTDVSDSALTSALLDFSWLGLLLYPLFLYAVCNLSIALSLQTNSLWLHLFALVALLQPAFSAAEGPILMTLTILRDYLALVVLFQVAKFLAWKPTKVQEN